MGRMALIAEVTFDRRVEELTAVVAVKSKHRERHAGFDLAGADEGDEEFAQGEQVVVSRRCVASSFIF